MGFAFFRDTTNGWQFGPPPPEPAIPAEFYERTEYVPFDTTLAAADIRGINRQQTRRNDSFEVWLHRVKLALGIVGLNLEYNLIRGGMNFYVLPSFAEARVGKFEVYLCLYHYDLWTPGAAAEQLRRDAITIRELKE